MACCTGARQPAAPTTARLKPMRERKSRREVSNPLLCLPVAGFGPGNPPGNSPVRRTPFFNSSGLFQYSGDAPIWIRPLWSLQLFAPLVTPLWSIQILRASSETLGDANACVVRPEITQLPTYPITKSLVVAARAICSRDRLGKFSSQAQGHALNIVGFNLGVLTMAFQAPAHGQRGLLLYAIHLLDRAVACLARHSRLNVLAVIEVHKVGQVVDLDPANRALLLDRFFQLLDFRGLLFHDIVAIHTDVGRRNACVAAGARRIVAIETRDLVVSGMKLVGKGDRLLR